MLPIYKEEVVWGVPDTLKEFKLIYQTNIFTPDEYIDFFSGFTKVDCAPSGTIFEPIWPQQLIQKKRLLLLLLFSILKNMSAEAVRNNNEMVQMPYILPQG